MKLFYAVAAIVALLVGLAALAVLFVSATVLPLPALAGVGLVQMLGLGAALFYFTRWVEY